MRLKRRPEFLAAARGFKWTSPAFVLQGTQRDEADGQIIGVGFTATKRLGKAVQRNRARRRLKEAARLVLPDGARPGHNYVIIARSAALTCPFSTLLGDLEAGFKGLGRKLARIPN
jgi:ribonuclease P protein component